MASSWHHRAWGTLMCAGMLSGCNELGLQGGTGTQTAQAPQGQISIEEREVEAPDVFSRQDNGLWDGRPSLGGVWIATPNVQAERVRVRNTDNDRVITAAMYRLPEDRVPAGFMVSSEAASQLGMIGGQSAPLSVVALRKETVEIPPVAPPQVLAALEEERLPSVSAVETEALETAPLAPAGGEGPAAETPAAESPPPSAAQDAETQEANSAQATPDPDPQTQAASGAAVAAAVATVLAPVPAQTAAAPAGSDAPPRRPAELTRSENRPQETATLAEDGTPANPFIAVASFSERDEASALITRLEAEGIRTKGRLLTDRAGTRYAVLAGPVESLEAQAALLDRIKALGFPGAFPSK